MLDTTGSRILVADDEPIQRRVMTKLLAKEGYDYAEAVDGANAYTMVTSYRPDLIIMDVRMPGLDGFEVAKKLKSKVFTAKIPIIMITSLNDRTSRERGLACGVEEFLTKPVSANELQIRVRNMLRMKLALDMLERDKQTLEDQVKARTRELSKSFEETICILMDAAEHRDDETGTHIRRISHYTNALAHQMGMRQEFCRMIFQCSPMHDIGKIGIPDHILLKQGALDEEEWKIMKQHTTIGEKILKKGKSPYLKMAREIALSHHECWDGSGYPHGIKGTQIPVSARIMRICDIYDALRSERPYKKAMSHKDTMKLIVQGDNRLRPEQFDPDVLEAFTLTESSMEEIFETTTDSTS